MKKYSLLLAVGFIFMPMAVLANGDHADFSEAQRIIEEEVPCEQLSDEQLRELGDYYMEQMHPGEAHVYMDQMMGGDGSEQLDTMHKIMGERFYCQSDDSAVMPSGMPMMMGGMMRGGGQAVMGSQMPMQQNAPSSFWQYQMNITAVLGWFFLLAGIAAFIKYLLKK